MIYVCYHLLGDLIKTVLIRIVYYYTLCKAFCWKKLYRDETDEILDFYHNVFVLSRCGRKHRQDLLDKTDLFHVFMKLYSSNNGQKVTSILTAIMSPYIDDKDIKGLIGLYLQNTKKEIWIRDLLAMLKRIGVTVDDHTELSQIIACDVDRLDNELNVLAHVTNRDLLLYDVQRSYRKVPEIVLAAVKNRGYNLQFAHDDLKRDREIVLAAVKKDACALNFAHQDLQRDREIVLAAVEKNADVLYYAHQDFKRDKDIILAAVRNSGGYLRYVHEDFKRDKDIVLAAVNNWGWALQWAHDDMKRDKAIVMAAVKVFPLALQFAHEDLRRDKDVVLVSLKRSMWN